MTSFDVKKEKVELLIEEKIKKNFPNSNFLIENTSSKHKKHKQNIRKFSKHSHAAIILLALADV